MSRYLLTALMSLSLAGVPAIVGCDETIESEKKVETKSDGTKVTEEKKIEETPSGDIKKTETKDVKTP